MVDLEEETKFVDGGGANAAVRLKQLVAPMTITLRRAMDTMLLL